MYRHSACHSLDELSSIWPTVEDCVSIFECQYRFRGRRKRLLADLIIHIESALDVEKESGRFGTVVALHLIAHFNSKNGFNNRIRDGVVGDLE